MRALMPKPMQMLPKIVEATRGVREWERGEVWVGMLDGRFLEGYVGSVFVCEAVV